METFNTGAETFNASWVDAYTELAKKLLPFKNNRQALIAIIKEVYTEINIKLPTLERDNNIVDIDPFTVFGLFNKNSQTNENRVKILSALSKKIGVGIAALSFEGVPTVNNQNATFYYFIGSRNAEDIDNLWGLFESALKYIGDKSQEARKEFCHFFNLVIGAKGNNNGKITMGLYWVSAREYLNLDSRNQWFIYETDKLPTALTQNLPKVTSKIPAERYLAILETIRSYFDTPDSLFHNFVELSSNAYLYSTAANGQKEPTEEQPTKISNASFLRWFAPLIQALRDLGGSATPAEAKAQIIKNENIPEEELKEVRGKTQVNKFDNEVQWARNYLANAGYIDKNIKGVWTLTESGMTVEMTYDLASEIFKGNINKKDNATNTLGDNDENETHYWLYAPGRNAENWGQFKSDGIMAIGWGQIGDLSDFPDKASMKAKMKELYGSEYSYKNDAHATWQFANEIKIGDVIFVKKGVSKIIGRGIVESDYIFDDAIDSDFKHIRRVNWTNIGLWEHPGKAALKTLTDITVYKEYVEKLNALFEDEDSEPIEEQEKLYDEYTEQNFLNDVFMSAENYDTLKNLILNKKNIILQGAPGVGKTFAAKRLAYSIMGKKDTNRVLMVQFHPSYSYEDFIMGYRPTSDGHFELKKGPFYNFCKLAEQDDKNNQYFFIIDEINRGNIGKIFGELFMLIENDKRGMKLPLIYGDEEFSIPENVHMIGMMNTADRSLAMLDYALRRRFAFFEFAPAFATEGFRKYRESKSNAKFDKLISAVEKINEMIENDVTLGKGFRIGHSYFCTKNTIDDKWLNAVVNYEILPLLDEYWFDDHAKVIECERILKEAIQ